jgi:hypothetical protein
MLALTSLPAVPGNAAVAARAHAANQFPAGKQKSAHPKKTGREKRDKDKARRIATYKLFRDPQFKLEGAIKDRRHFEVMTNGNAPNAGRSPQGMMTSRMPATGIPQTAFKATQSEGAGLDFNCHEKILNPTIANRETSACYQYEVGRAWKAQTYVSRQRTEGNWGGGLALGFAY